MFRNLGFTGNCSWMRASLGTGTEYRNLGSQSQTEMLWEPGVTGNGGILESPGNLGSLRHSELRIPGVTRMTSGSRIHRRTPPSGVTRNSGFAKSPERLQVRVVTRRAHGFLSHPGLRVPVVKRNTGFQRSPGTPDSRRQPEFKVPGVTRNSVSWIHQEHGFPECTQNPHSWSHTELRLPRVTWTTPGSRSQPEDSEFPYSPITPRSRSNIESWFPESPGGLRVTGVTLNSGLPD